MQYEVIESFTPARNEYVSDCGTVSPSVAVTRIATPVLFSGYEDS